MKNLPDDGEQDKKRKRAILELLSLLSPPKRSEFHRPVAQPSLHFVPATPPTITPAMSLDLSELEDVLNNIYRFAHHVQPKYDGPESIAEIENIMNSIYSFAHHIKPK